MLNKAFAFVYLIAVSAVVSLTAPIANAATYSTSGLPTLYSLGDQIGSQYDILAVTGTSGTLVDGGKIILDTLSFTAGVNASVPATATGSITQTMTVDSGKQQFSVPFSLSINYTDTLTVIGGTTLSFLDSLGTLWQIVVDGLTIGPNPGGTMTANLMANVSDPPPVPLPAAIPLFASGLGAMGLFSLWKRRKAGRFFVR